MLVSDFEGRMNRGKLLALLMIVAGVAAGVWAIVSLHGQQRRVIEAWSPPAAELIAHAPQAILQRIIPTAAGQSSAPPGAEHLQIHDTLYYVAQKKDVTSAAGFTYLRNALLHDGSYGWDHPPQNADPVWQYILDFVDGPSHFAFAFDLSSPCMMKLEGGKTLSIRPIAGGVQAFFEEQFPPAQSAQRREN